jgi:hypothetical protein
MPLPRLNGTLTPVGAPRYDQLFKDQLVTIVLAIGFDEYGANRPIDDEIEAGLLDRGFVADPDAALARLAAGKRPAPQRHADHFLATGITRDAAGAPVDAVVSLIRAGDGSAGGEAGSAFLEGLDRCDISAYGGHGRYGTGPDFDYNFTADLVDEKGAIVSSFSEYRDLEEMLQERARARGRSALAEYRTLTHQRRLLIRRVNSGNLVVNLRNYHPAEFGAHLMVDQLKTDANVRRMSKQKFAKKYRLWMFNGCRTHDYFLNLRKLNPQANAGGLDLVGTRRVIYWSAIAESLLGMLDGVFAREDYRPLLARLAAINPDDYSDGEPGPSHVVELARRA